MRAASVLTVPLALAASTPALALPPENHDVFMSRAPAPHGIAEMDPETRHRVRRGLVRSLEPRLGVPSFFWGSRDPVPSTIHEAEAAARFHLRAFAPLYRASAEIEHHAVVQHVHDLGDGPIIVTLTARLSGVDVFRDALRVVMDRDLRLIALSGYLSPHVAANATRRLVFDLDSSAAIATAIFDATGALTDLSSFVRGPRDNGGFDTYHLDPFLSAEVALRTPARVRRVLYGDTKELIEAYHLEVHVESPIMQLPLHMAYVISARDGRVLFSKNLFEHQDFTYRVYVGPDGLPMDGPMGNGENPFPFSGPTPIRRTWIDSSTVTLAHGPISTGDPWLPAGATESVGNNVDAYVDRNAPDGLGSGDHRVEVTSSGTFDHRFDPTSGAHTTRAQRDAALTNLFYVINYLHDWLYDKGLDEVAGNAQNDNYGRGGAEGDRIVARGQSHRGRNNAAMSTPADGRSPTMMLFRYDGVDEVTVSVTAPTSIAGVAQAGAASFGPQSFNVSGDVVVGRDGDGDPLDGCQPLLTNSATITGNIVLVARGNCSFGDKVRNAQAEGAAAVIITDNVAGLTPPPLGGTANNVNIPSASLTRVNGNLLRAQIDAGRVVTVTVQRVDRPDMDPSLGVMTTTHEFAHYVTNRLIGNSSGLSTNQARGMGEGWSDFHALLMTTEASDLSSPQNANWTGTYAASGYTAARGPYFGVRRVPYSTDFAKNALTFRHIENGVALPSGVPTAYGLDGSNNAQVHATGEVWGTMLWECYVSLLRDPRYSFVQAREQMARYMIAAYKVTPNAPTLVEARDAMLAVALATEPADFRLFWTAFARRGLGFGAVAPDRATTTNGPLVESFAVGNALEVVTTSVTDTVNSCDRDGVLDVGERGRFFVTVKNTGIDVLSTVTGTITTQSAGVRLPGPRSFTVGPLGPLEVAVASVPIEVVGLTTPGVAELNVEVDAPEITSGPVTQNASFRVNTDDVAASATVDPVDTRTTPWTPQIDGGRPLSSRWRRTQLTATDQRWFGAADGFPADTWLTSPPLQISATSNFSFSFVHRYSIEDGWDGARIELTRDGGQSWQDIGGRASPGYDRTLRDNTPTPFTGRRAYTGRNASWPGTDRVQVDLGRDYRGQTVQIRFRVGTDWSVTWWGWEIDDLSFSGIDNTPFPTLVADRGICANRPPVANAGADFSADERSMVTLDPSGSTDPDNDPLTFRWAQLEGPPVLLAGDTFIAPVVTRDTALRFALYAMDAEFTSAPDEVVVTIVNLNRAPSADAGPDVTVDERASVTLSGSGSDPDNDPLTYRWTQVGGSTLTATGTLTPSLTFIAPEVEADTVYTFALVAQDGAAVSPPSEVRVTVRDVNRAPFADAGPDQMADERQAVQLLGRGVDPDGDRLTYQWQQTDGLMVSLAGATTATPTFTAPEVSAEARLEFSLTVSDGTLTSTPSTTSVLVRKVNRAPVVGDPAPFTVNEEGMVQLSVEATDPDGDPLGYEWRQTSGPSVSLEGTGAQRTLTAPAVDSDAPVELLIAVSDGTDTTTVSARGTILDRAGPPLGDAGVGRDGMTVAGRDAGTSADAGGAPDVAEPTEPDGINEACDCQTSGTTGGRGAWALLLGALLCRRRRTSRERR